MSNEPRKRKKDGKDKPKVPEPLDLDYDEDEDVLEIDGVKFHGQVFRLLGSTDAIGKIFRLALAKNGRIVLEELEMDANFGISSKRDLRFG